MHRPLVHGRRLAGAAALFGTFVLATVTAQDPSVQAPSATGRAPAGTRAALPAGVTPAIADAIDGGVAYLVRTQAPDGSWGRHGAHGRNRGAMTALATLALLADGNTPTRGPRWFAVRRAVGFLLRSQDANGFLAPPDESTPMFAHGFTMLALAQVLGAEEDRVRQREITAALHRAIDLTAASQSRDGGWLYYPDDIGDEGSVTITQVQGLRACRDAGLTVPADTIAHAVEYVRESVNPDGGVRYQRGHAGPSQPPITAAGVAVLYEAGRYDDPIAERMLTFASRTVGIDRSQPHWFYAHRYLAQALYQRGGIEWVEHYARLSATLLARRSNDGSWAGEGVGPVYGTAMALIVLQLPHARLPAHQR